MKKTSCGIIITDGKSILLGHITHGKHYDIPKGQLDVGETEEQCAVRELYEETGLIADTNSLVPLGKFAYKKTKDLVLFLLKVDAMPDPENCICHSMFELKGKNYPELDDFIVVSYSVAFDLMNADLKRVLMQALGVN